MRKHVEQPKAAGLTQLVERVDIGTCHHCGRDLRLVACIDDPDAIAKILTHLDLPTEIPPIAPARSPLQAEFEHWDSPC